MTRLLLIPNDRDDLTERSSVTEPMWILSKSDPESKLVDYLDIDHRKILENTTDIKSTRKIAHSKKSRYASK